MTRLYCLLLVLVLCIPAAVSAADWPQFRGPNADGISPEKGINRDWNTKPPQKLWEVSLTDGGYAGPSAADGKVFIIDHQGSQDIVRALDLLTGNEVWKFAYEDTKNGNYGFARSTPAFDNGKLYILSRLGLVNCLNAKTGENIWARDIIKDFGGQRPGWDLCISPVIDGEKLILCPGGKAAVVALNKATGETIWQSASGSAAGYATPLITTIAGVKQYVIFAVSGLLSINPQDGSKLWDFEWRTGCDVNAAVPIVVGNSVFITSGYGHGCALVDIADGKTKDRWQNKEYQSRFGTPLYMKGLLFSTTESGNLMCLDPATDEVKWKEPGFGWGAASAVDGMLIVFNGDKGDLVMINPTGVGYMELGRFKPLGGQSWTAPIVADKKLIVRNTKTLACFDLK